MDLEGGTTGQVLAKNSNTDMDFIWTNGGDITEVTAGTGISGGGTSGAVTITNSMATAIDAKGDLVAGTGADAFSRLAVGANATVLTADSTTATGLKWAAASAGKLIQIVEGTTSTYATSSSSTYSDTNLTVTITPTLATSQILVIVSQQGCGKSASNAGTANQIRLMRGATQISNTGDGLFRTAGTGLEAFYSVIMMKLDSPATTSATTYKTQFRSVTGTSMTYVNYYTGEAPTSSIVAIEIGA
jgi:hypothetical protein